MTVRDLVKSHMLALAIYEATEHLKPVNRPQAFAGEPLKQAYAGYRAQRQAYRALHSRDRVTAAVLAKQAEINLKLYKGEA